MTLYNNNISLNSRREFCSLRGFAESSVIAAADIIGIWHRRPIYYYYIIIIIIIHIFTPIRTHVYIT